MPPFRSPDLRPDLARWAAETIRTSFDEFMEATLAQRAFGGGPQQIEDVE